jgi:N-acyl-D-amino-acid deacylase
MSLDILLDTLFQNVRVIDGTGHSEYLADVGILDDRIVFISTPTNPGNKPKTQAKNLIECTGLCLAPGFIDVHTHDDLYLIRSPTMLPKISQGVTTVIVGNCGISAACSIINTDSMHLADPMSLLGKVDEFRYAKMKEYTQAIKEAQPAVNVAVLIGHTTLRSNHLPPESLNRSASRLEVELMCSQLREAMDQGRDVTKFQIFHLFARDGYKL